MANIAVKVENLSKLYKIGTRQQGYKTLRESIMGNFTAPFRRLKRMAQSTLILEPSSLSLEPSRDTIWALKDVSFEVKRGEVIGIIGPNGAGKTTLLKILSQITEPTRGKVELHGRVGSLLEVGTGFHPELTGRENIYLNGAILGMSREEINRKFDEIVDFAEIEKFIDTPVKRYSSGMYVRLAFAVSAHIEPDILIVDEVLAVGDSAFQRKCLGKMGDVAKAGRTVLFVSHNMATVTNLCPIAFLFRDGRMVESGPSNKVVGIYLQEERANLGVPVAERTDRDGKGTIRCTKIAFQNSEGKAVDTLLSGDQVQVIMEYKAHEFPLPRDTIVSFSLRNFMDQPLSAFRTELVALYSDTPVPKSGRICCLVPKLPLQPGSFYITVCIRSRSEGLIDLVPAAAKLEVVAGDYFGTGKLSSMSSAPLLINHEWLSLLE
jgi:lipopolysaccharide transport system ATP-binding protein